MSSPTLSISVALILILFIVIPVQSRFPLKLQNQFGYLDTEEYYQWAVKIRNGSQAYRSLSARDQPEARVVGGKEAPEGAAPFQISLLKNYIIVKSHMCGGSFLTPNTVVTAAHCTYEQSASSLIIRYGTNKRSSSQYPDLSVNRIVQHADYNPNTIENDISLLILSKPITPSSNANIIEIETEPQEDNAKVLVYGWGLTDGNSQTLPENLQVGEMSIVSNEKCNQKWGSVNAIADGMICALDATQSACNGDSGGPLVSSNGRLTGIVSWGPSKCPPGEYMSVFTRPSYYSKWIEVNQV